MSMTDKVLIQETEVLPIPRIAFPDIQSLAHWYTDQLEREYASGKRDLTMACFDTTGLGLDPTRSAYVVLREITEFLYDHTDIESLSLLCGGPKAMRAYSLNWNMWYAEHKPDGDDDEEEEEH